MKVKVRLAGGSRYDDDGLLWTGVLDELVPAGASMLLADDDLDKVALNVVSTSVEIISDSITYVLFVSPVSKVDNDVLELYRTRAKVPQSQSGQVKT